MMIIINDDMHQGDQLCFNNFKMEDVSFIKNSNSKDKAIVRWPDGIQCLTEIKNLFYTKQEAVDEIIKRIEAMEGVFISPQKPKLVRESSQLIKMMSLFDTELKNLAFEQIITTIHERLERLEQKDSFINLVG